MQRHTAEMLQRYARAAPRELPGLLHQRLCEEPRCAVTRYLAGCQCFDRGHPALATRHMMVAHRVEPCFQSAALLAFAGLTWTSRPQAPLLPVLLDTWEDFRRPEFDRFPRERRLLDCFAEPAPGRDGVADLARRLWRLPIRTLRAQIREAVASRDATLYPLLTVPA